MPYLSKKYLNELKDKKKLDVEKIINGPFVNKKKGNKYDVFLSYSYSDKNFALIIYALLMECGINTYIDVNDDYLDRDDVGEETAKIRKKYAKAVCNRLENSFYKQLLNSF